MASTLGFYEKRGWVGQYKKNGTCNVLWVTNEREIICKTRHDADHLAWMPTDISNAPFKALKGDGWYVFVTELLHSKVSGLRDTHYIFDILVANGQNLVGMTFSQRMAILESLFLTGAEDETDSHYVITPNVWLAKTITSGFKETFATIDDGTPENEGFVMKKPDARLEICGKSANTKWMVKCRRTHENYGF